MRQPRMQGQGRTSVRRILAIVAAVGIVVVMTTPANALEVVTKVRVARVEILSGGNARVTFRVTCPAYDYQVHQATVHVGQSNPGHPSPSASTTFSEDVVCDGTTRRLVKTLVSTTGQPFGPSLYTSARLALVLSSESDPYPGYFHADDVARFLPSGAREADVTIERVWVNDRGWVKTRFTYYCPTGQVFDENDDDTIEIVWGQSQPTQDVVIGEGLWSDLVCDGTPHTIVKSEGGGFSPAYPVVVDVHAGSFFQIVVLPQ